MPRRNNQSTKQNQSPAQNQNLTSDALMDMLRQPGGSNQATADLRRGNLVSNREQQMSAMDFFQSNPSLQPFGEALQASGQGQARESGRSFADNLRRANERDTGNVDGRTSLRASADNLLGREGTRAQEAVREDDMRRLQESQDLTLSSGQQSVADPDSIEELIQRSQTGDGSSFLALVERAQQEEQQAAQQAQESGETPARTGQAATTETSVTPEGQQAQEEVQRATSESPIGGRGVSSPEVVDAVQRDEATKQELGISSSDLYPEGESVGEADMINQWLDSSEGRAALQRQRMENMSAEAEAEQMRNEVESQFAEEKREMEHSLAERGLAFSGIRASQVRDLAENLAQSQLGIDREFASQLLNADQNMQETIIEGVGSLIEQAQRNEEQAVEQLNKAGYAVIDDMLVPTQSAQNAEHSQRIADARLSLEGQRVQLAEQAERRQMQEMSNREFHRQFQRNQTLAEQQQQAALIDFFVDEENRNIPEEQLKAFAMNNGYSKTLVDAVASVRQRPQETLEYMSSELISNALSEAEIDVQGGFRKGLTAVTGGSTRQVAANEAANVLNRAKNAVTQRVKANPDSFRNEAERDAVLELVPKMSLDDVLPVLDGIAPEQADAIRGLQRNMGQ